MLGHGHAAQFRNIRASPHNQKYTRIRDMWPARIRVRLCFRAGWKMCQLVGLSPSRLELAPHAGAPP
eukprot:2191918-Pyramimonas_sp.AAC.1